MEKIELRTIADLERIGKSTVRRLLRSWDFAGEVQEWARTVAMKGMLWTTTYTWNEGRRHCRFHPSSFKHPCDMHLFLQLIGEKEVRKRQPQQTIFDTGTVIHLQMSYYLHTMAICNNFVFDDEVKLWKTSKVADKYQLCGSADGIMEREIVLKDHDVTLNLRTVIDWKSINDSGFSSLRDSAGPDYEKQMHGYMITGDIPVTLVFYINKDKSIFKSIPVLFSPKVWDPIADRLTGIINLLNNLQEPKRTVGNHCYYCNFLEVCAPNGLRSKRRRNAEPRL